MTETLAGGVRLRGIPGLAGTCVGPTVVPAALPVVPGVPVSVRIGRVRLGRAAAARAGSGPALEAQVALDVPHA